MISEALPEILRAIGIILALLTIVAAFFVGLHIITTVFAWVMDTMFKAGQSQ